MMESNTIKLTSSEGISFEICKNSARLSQLLKGAIEDFQGEINISLPDIDTNTTKIIIEYLLHWKGNEPPKIKKPKESCLLMTLVDEWSASFIDKLSLEEIGILAVAANFMEIQPLVELTCCKIAAIGQSKPIDELFVECGIDPAFFTEAERQKIREENIDWLNDDPEEFLRVDENDI